MCGSEVERKKRQQEFNSTRMILLVCTVTYPLQCGRDRRCSGSEVERKKRQQEFNSTRMILFLCLRYLPPTVWQRQTDVW